MKKYKILTVLVAVTFVLASNGYSDGNVNNSPKGFVRIPAGTFKKGDDFRPDTVVLTRGFFMCNHEVTQKQYESIMGTNPSRFKDNPARGEIQERRPVDAVSWFDAIEYCNRRSIKEGLKPCYKINGTTNPEKWGANPASGAENSAWFNVTCNWNANGYRLPTEAEWEYVARKGDVTSSSKFDTDSEYLANLSKYAWYISNSTNKTHEIKKKMPDKLGLFDMRGNVYEWCWGSFDNIYVSSGRRFVDPIRGDLGAAGSVLLGGAWCYVAGETEIGYKHSEHPCTKYPWIVEGYDYDYKRSCYGFRVVRTDSSTVTPAHQKQVKEQEEKVAERIRKDEEQYKENKEKSEKFMEGEMVKIAKQLLANNIPPEVIASMTGLDVSEINKLLESDKN